jgi:hypothetical protein
MITNKLRITELDFDGIKENLKKFLSSNDSSLKIDGSFDFEGSTFSTLLDVLAYNTHYMGYYTNMLANEMFLDSATKRESIVSIAKHLGYTPRSASSATITFDVTNLSPTEDCTILPTDVFEGKTENDAVFKFYPIDEYNVKKGQTESIICREGKLVTREYIANSNNLDQKYILDKNMDKVSLVVKVKGDSSANDNTFIPFTEFEDITNLLQTGATVATVYYLNEVESGQFEVVFGDGVETGLKIPDGSVIQLKYLISSLEDSNGINNIAEATESGNFTELVVTSNASGGAEPQSIESIRYMAPKSFQSQNRAVTSDDYATLVEEKFPLLKSVITWGGEDNDPVAFGKVFISIWKQNNEFLTDADKLWVRTEMLKRNKVIGIVPEVVDPDFTYLKVAVDVLYDSTLAVTPAGTIMNKVSDAILAYGVTELDSFGKDFRFSPLSSSVDDTDSAVVSNFMTLSLYKTVTPSIVSGQSDAWELKFNTELDSVSSDYFSTSDFSTVKFVETDGVLNLVNINGETVQAEVGLVSSNGKVDVNPIDITTSASITFSSTIDQKDVELLKGQVMVINESDIDVVMRRA